MARSNRRPERSRSDYPPPHEEPIAGEFGQESVYRQRAEQSGYAQAGYGRPGFGESDHAPNYQGGEHAASGSSDWIQAGPPQGYGQARYSQGVPGQGGGYSQGGFEPGYRENQGGRAAGGAGLGGFVEGAYGRGAPLGHGGILQQGAQAGHGSSRGGHRGRGPKGYQRSDERIREDVCEALYQDDDVDASDIEVQVENGEVILTGTAPSRFMKRWAEDLAEQCIGVRDVHNQLRIKRHESDAPAPRGGASDRSQKKSGKK